MSQPVVTVCVPVYNTARYIKQCIESVFAQEFKDWILLVSDNCSTDGTWEILQQFHHPQMRVFRQPKTTEPGPNWMFLWNRVETDYFCFLGSDDYFYPNHLGNKVRLLERFPEAPFVHGAVRFTDSEGNEQPGDDFKCAILEERKETLPRFLKVNFVNITSAVFRVAALRRHDRVFDSRYRFMGDWACFLKLAMLDGSVVYDEEPTVVYRIHPLSDARKAIHTFAWSYEATRMRVDALMENPAVWRQIGVDPDAEARLLTRSFWQLAFNQARRGKFANARQAWNLFREFHSPSDALYDLPRHLGTGVQKIAGSGRSCKKQDTSFK